MNTFLKFERPANRKQEDCSPDGVHSMERARWEAEGFVSTITWMNQGEYFQEKKITTGQLYSFLMFFLSLMIVVFAEGSQFLIAVLARRMKRDCTVPYRP